MSKRVLNLFWGNFFQKNCYPSVPWRLESSKIFKKIKKISKFQKCPKSFPKASKRVLNVFWGEFFEKFFAQCSMDGRVFKNFQKNQKNFKVPKMPKIVPESIQTCFEQVLGQIFREIFAQFSMECRVFETFQKKSKNFQNSNQKRTKPFPKESKSVLNIFWGNFFEKFLPSFPWGVESSKIFKKKQRIFKVPKKPKIVTKSVQTCFELVLGQIFPKKMLSQCSMEARVFETFQKKSKNFQNSNQKRTKPFPKESKSVLNMFWGKFFEKFLPSFPWKVESSKIFKKIKKKFKIPKRPKIVPKSIQTSSERVLRQFFRKTFAQFSMEGRVFENFQKKTKNFQSSKKAENRYQKCPNVF